MDVALVWLLYLLAALVFLSAWWGVTGFIESEWLKVVIRYPLVGLILMPISIVDQFSFFPEFGLLSQQLAPAIMVCVFALLDQGLTLSSLLLVMLSGWLSLMVGVAKLFLCMQKT